MNNVINEERVLPIVQTAGNVDLTAVAQFKFVSKCYSVAQLISDTQPTEPQQNQAENKRWT